MRRDEKFLPGERVLHEDSGQDHGKYGTVLATYGVLVGVRYDDEDKDTFAAKVSLRKVNLLEELAKLGKRNPTNFRPRAGQRVVHFLDETCSDPGTILGVHSGAATVRWDSGKVRLEYNSVLRPYSPLEEIAKVGRQTNNNPDQDYVVGDLVRVTQGVRKGKIGKVLVVTRWGCVIGMEDRALQYSFSQLEKLTPIELLALTAKRNPQMYKHFEKGQRVTYRGAPATVHRCRRGEAHVHFDGQEPDPRGWKLPSNDLELLSPLEELALTAKKNPNPAYAVGDRVIESLERYSGMKGRVGTVTDLCAYMHYPSVWVVFDGSTVNMLVEICILRRISPLEELSRAGGGGK
jgi:hypothetical protein